MSSFPDLSGLHNSASSGDEHFWPSFTDIMMVVVMIFLISTAFLIIRNWGLTQQLTTTLESEKKATQTAQMRLEENLTLEERLAALEQLLSTAQLKKMQILEAKKKLEKRLAVLSTQLTNATDLSSKLNIRLNTKAEKITALAQQLEKLEAERNQALNEKTQKEKLLLDIRSELNNTKGDLRELKAKREKELARAQNQANTQASTLTKLQGDFENLQKKYDKLVRPARTTKGKHVIAIRYLSEFDQQQIEIKQPSETDYMPYSEIEMHQLLTQLKEKYRNRLYIRIIFPENNQLSYKEAWGFTNEILKKYDYYHQDEIQD